MTPELRKLTACAALALLLALPGCNSEKRQTAQGGTAGGEVLEASVSDAMLPTDQVRSQAPLAPRTEAAKGARRADEDGVEELAEAVEGDSGDAANAGSGDAPPPPPPPAMPDGE